MPEMNVWDRIAAEYAKLGVSANYHPMGLLRPKLHEGIVHSRMLEAMPDGAAIKTAGLVTCRQRPGTAKGFVFLTLEDEYGLTNVILRPGLYDAERSVIRTSPFLVVRGRLQQKDGTTNVLADALLPLEVTGVTPKSHDFG